MQRKNDMMEHSLAKFWWKNEKLVRYEYALPIEQTNSNKEGEIDADRRQLHLMYCTSEQQES